MRKTTYIVAFETGETSTVNAFNEAQARILAQGVQILEGNDYKVKDVLEVD